MVLPLIAGALSWLVPTIADYFGGDEDEEYYEDGYYEDDYEEDDGWSWW